MEFTAKYDKVYGSMEEFNQKFENFKNNLIEILAEDDFEGPHTMGITKFSDLTKAEFKSQYLTLQTPNSWCQPGLQFQGEAPASMDWRDKNGVSPVKDQGQCGSCWAFSAVGYLESQSLIKNQKLVTYSEQQLVDCDHLGDQGCNGGLMQTALKYVQANGIESDKDYPYRARDQSCSFDKSKVIAKTSNIKCYEGVQTNTIQGYVASVGPLSIAVDASSFQSYHGGVLQCRGSSLNHGVLLVGYTQDSWIVKNSWGKNWGEKGFVRVSNKSGANCGIGAYIVTSDLN
jgi:C1A family cysteine protease